MIELLLRRINLSDNDWVNDDLVASIVMNCLDLEEISLRNCRSVTRVGIRDLHWPQNLSDISRIEADLPLNRVTLERFTGFTYEEVEMDETGLGRSKSSFEENDVVVNRRIRSLNLSKNDTLSDESMKKMVAATSPNLESLKLDSCDLISSKGVEVVMRSCHYLKDLHIRGCSSVKSLEIVADSLLESLDASESTLDDRGLIEIANKCPNLMFVKLSKCAYVTSKGVTELLAWMISIRPSLRRIVPPDKVSDFDSIKSFDGEVYVIREI
ncbi:hypothetical protein V2J09_003083 [Rumex salicifolius]